MENLSLEHEDMLPSVPPMSLTEDPTVPLTIPQANFEGSTKQRNVWWMLPLAILVLGAIATIFFLSARSLISASPRSAVNAFFDNVESGQTANAYAETASVFKKVGTEEQFAALVKDKPHLFLTKRTFTTLDIKGNQADARGTLTLADGSEVPIHILLLQEEGKWKVSGFSTGDDAK